MLSKSFSILACYHSLLKTYWELSFSEYVFLVFYSQHNLLLLFAPHVATFQL